MTESLTVSYSLVSEADIFRQQLENSQSQGLIAIKSHELGADREQWFLDWQEQMLVICIEHLSESAWIEPIGYVSQERLQNFYKQVICY